MIKAVDLSNWSAIPTPAQVQCLKDQGYSHAFVGSSFGSVWRQQIAALEKGGMVVGEYMFPEHVHDTDRDWWLDIERSPGTTVTQQTVRAAINDAVNKPKGIYSNRTAFVDCIGFDWRIKQEYEWLACWDANYGDLPRPFIPFGGFTIEDRIITQWAGSTNLCGLNVDLNVMEDEDMPLTEDDLNKIAHKLATDPEFVKALVDTSYLGAKREVKDMQDAGQVKPPHP